MKTLLRLAVSSVIPYVTYGVIALTALISIYFFVGRHFENKLIANISNKYQARVKLLEGHENLLEKEYHNKLDKLKLGKIKNEEKIKLVDKDWYDTKLPESALRVLR